jgi:beta-glucanase (GH16 family)
VYDSQSTENDLYLNKISIQPLMNKFSRALFLFIGLTVNLPAQDWQLVWEDQFNGTQLDATKWAHDLGTGTQYGLWGWGNGELQSYQEENTVVSDGTLKIIAKEEPAGVVDPYNASNVMNYSSSKIITAGLFTFRYGRVQARIKTVVGQGFWPAFWMLPTDGSWPCDGEIDIMEQGNRITGNTEAEITTGAAHLGPCSEDGSTYRSFSKTIENGSFADDFHVYEVRWEPNRITWYVDGEYLFNVTPDDYPSEYTWPFNESDWFLMLNLAIDKNGPSVNTQFPSQIEVDWVRVYQENTSSSECTDAEAYNYNANAVTDDGSCLYEVNFEVDMNCVSFIPEYVSVSGLDGSTCGSGIILQERGDSRIWTGKAYLPNGAHSYNYCTDGGDHHEDLLLYANEQGDWSCVASTDSASTAKREVFVDRAMQLSDVWSSCSPCVD